MALNYNPTTNAVGTQRQFTKQSENTYQKRLLDSRFSGGNIGVDLDAQSLQRALGIIGNATINEGVAMDKRDAMYTDYVKGLAQRDPEALKRLNTIEYLNMHSNFDLDSNPYAKAVIDNMRGEYLMGEAKLKAEEERATQPLEKTSAERVKRFGEIANETFLKYKDLADNTDAFSSGFYGSYLKDNLLVADGWQKEKAANLKVQAVELVASSLDKIMENSFRQPSEQTIGDLQLLIDKARTTQLNEGDLYKLFEPALTRMAEYTGNGDLIEKVKGLKYSKDKDGKDITLGEAFEWLPLNKVAGLRGVQIRNQESAKALDELDKCTSKEQVNAFFDKLQKDPSQKVVYEGMLGQRASAYARIEQEENKKRNALLKQQVSSINSSSMADGFLAGMDAYVVGAEKDKYGHTSNTLFYKKVDKEGNVTDVRMKQADVEQFLPLYIDRINQNNELTEDEKVKRTLTVLSHPDCKFYAKNMADLSDRALMTLDTSTARTDSRGNYILPNNVSSMIRLRKYGNGEYELAFGGTNTANIDALVSLQESLGDENMGTNTFLKAREKLKDENFNERIKTSMRNMEFNWSDFDDCMGGKNSVSDENSKEWDDSVRTQVKYMLAAGMCEGDIDKCKNLALERLRKSMVVYRGSLIPKAVMDGLDKRMFAEGVDYLMADYREKAGLTDKDPVSVKWNTKTMSLEFRSNYRSTQSFTVSDLRNQTVYVMNEMKKPGKGGNVEAVGKKQSDFGYQVEPTVAIAQGMTLK